MGTTNKPQHRGRPTNTYYGSSNKIYKFDTTIKHLKRTEQKSSYVLQLSLFTIEENNFSVEGCSTKIVEIHSMPSYVSTW